METNEKIKDIENLFSSEIENITSLKELQDLKVKYLGKKGLITDLTANMKDLSIEEKKTLGMVVNVLKTSVSDKISEVEKYLHEKELNEKLEKEKIDISLPSTKIPVGSPNILEKIIEEVEEVFMSMGYDVVDGPEIEEDRYNFELLNIPKGHPARDAQDTFYIKDEEILLRSQTSPVQVRTMLSMGGNEPVRMICPGKTYRRDDDDATHSHQFMQIEGLLIHKYIRSYEL